jgi:para-nitrobenzyl esterase
MLMSMLYRRSWSRAALLCALMTCVLALLGLTREAAAQDQRGDSAGGAVVATTGGPVRGITRTNYSAWLGIPYAKPPVGDLRWKAPQPADSWPGVRDATKFGKRCVQGTGWDPGYETPQLSEDCLSLNVYAPKDRKFRGRPNRRPVMVWIHGGGFTGGAGQDTDPRKYVQHDGIVYVTINYRLGALGFLSLPELRDQDEGAGNFGLLDQQVALRWVQDNIAAFGGNPRNVTIAGQSAGGASICDQLSSPAAKRLFQRAIIMSGGCSMAAQDAADQAGLTYAKAAGCTDPATALTCLRGKSAAELLQAQSTAGVRLNPAVGGAFPIDPADAVKTGRFNRVPVMNGQVHDENTLFVFQNNDYAGHPVTPQQYEATIRSSYGAGANAVLAAYPLADYPSPSVALARVQSDAGSYTRLRLDRQLSRFVPTYAYEFAERETPQFYSIHRLQQTNEVARNFPFGATHVDDLPYLWEYLGHTLPFTDDELELSDQMISFWSQFQQAGDPNGPDVPGWPAFDRDGSWMSLNACETAEASADPPAACSAATTDYVGDHKLDLWASVLGS